MVVGILPDIVKIVVLPSGADALLGVIRSPEPAKWRRGVHGPKKDRLELVHSRVGEEKGGIIEGNHGARPPVDVLLALEKAEEGFPHLGRRPLHRCRLVGHLHRLLGDEGSGGEDRGANPSPREDEVAERLENGEEDHAPTTAVEGYLY